MMNVINRIIHPINPKLEEKVVKIKSVLASGKYRGVLLKPNPNSPAADIAIKELSN